MNIENSEKIKKDWLAFKKSYEKQVSWQKFLNKFKSLRDSDPREMLMPLLYEKKYLKAAWGAVRFFGKEFLNRMYSIRHPNPVLDRPIFIVGMPHSGTSIFMKLFTENPSASNSSEMNTFFYGNGKYLLPECDHTLTKKDVDKKEIKRLSRRLNLLHCSHH